MTVSVTIRVVAAASRRGLRVTHGGRWHHLTGDTDKGMALYPVIVAMMRWGDEWLDWPEGPPIKLVDKASGEAIDPVLVDRHTGEPLEPRRIRVVTAAEGRGQPRAPTAPAADR